MEDNKDKQENETIQYSEKEVEALLISCKDRFGGSDLDDYVSDSEVKNWFQKIKKKK
jgi:hypothetical protein